MKIEEVVLKEPFKRIKPSPMVDDTLGPSDGRLQRVSQGVDLYDIVSQDSFLREYFVTGHKIFSPAYYCDRIKQDDKGKSYIHFVERVGIPFQRVIVTKRLTHLCGNNIEFKAPGSSEDLVTEFKNGWIDKNMEIAWFESAKSAAITGDCAFCGYFDSEGRFRWKTFSYLKGDILYPHHNPVTEELEIFGRQYKQLDEDGNSVDFLDVYDNAYVTTYRRGGGGFWGNIKRKLWGSEWEQVGEPIAHGFPFIPVSYHRPMDSPIWSPVQDLIDKLEIAISQLAENNKTYAFRLLFLKGDNVSTVIDASGQPTAIVGDENSDAKYLDKADPSSSFEAQIKYYLQWIFMGSFTVLPPEVKSGDLPGVAIKLLYSPAIEVAMEESQEWDSFIDSMVRTFKVGYGKEKKMSAQFDNMNVRGEIIPYVHQNDAEIINNLNSSVLAGTLSARTAASKHPEAAADEWDRIEEEKQMELSAAAEIAEASKPKENSTNQAREAVNKEE